MVRINKYVDLLDRVVWTFIQSFVGFVSVDALLNAELSWQTKIMAPAIAALFAAVKTVFGQNTGSDDTGAVVPGASVVEG